MVGFVHDVTGDQQRGSGARKIRELLPKIHPQYGVEAHCGFVEHEQIRPADKRARQRSPGALTAGEVAAVRAAVICQTHPLDGVIGGATVDSIQRREVANVVDDPQVVVNGRVLRHVPDSSAQCGRSGGMTEHGDRARGHDLSAHDAPHQRGLAATGRSEQPGDGAAGDPYREVLQCYVFATNHP